MTRRRWIPAAIAAAGATLLAVVVVVISLVGVPSEGGLPGALLGSDRPVSQAPSPSADPTATASPSQSAGASATASPGASRPAVPAVPAGSALCGVSFANEGLSYSGALAQEDTRFGGVDMVRVFFPGAPPAWSGSTADIPRRTVNVSFKFDADDVVAGKHDAAMRTWFAGVPRNVDVYWTYYHEPEDNIRDGEFTAAQYRAAWQRLRGLANAAGNPRLRSALVLMEWSLRPASGRNWRNYYPGRATIDVLSWDVYNAQAAKGGYAAPATLFGQIVAVAKAEGKPWAVSEFGSHLATGDTGTARAAWLNASVRYLMEQKALFAAYFDHDWETGDYRIRDTAGIAQWKAFCAKH